MPADVRRGSVGGWPIAPGSAGPPRNSRGHPLSFPQNVPQVARTPQESGLVAETDPSGADRIPAPEEIPRWLCVPWLSASDSATARRVGLLCLLGVRLYPGACAVGQGVPPWVPRTFRPETCVARVAYLKVEYVVVRYRTAPHLTRLQQDWILTLYNDGATPISIHAALGSSRRWESRPWCGRGTRRT